MKSLIIVLMLFIATNANARYYPYNEQDYNTNTRQSQQCYTTCQTIGTIQTCNTFCS